MLNSSVTGLTNYQNNNGNPPYNNNPKSNTSSNSVKLYELAATIINLPIWENAKGELYKKGDELPALIKQIKNKQ